MNTEYSNRIQDQRSDKGVRPLSTALKTLELLRQFAVASRPLRLGEVASAAGLSRATCYQRLLTLAEAGLIEQDAEGRYRLTMFPVRLAAAALEQASLGSRSEAVLARLNAATGETATLAVLEKGAPCIVARVETDNLLRAEQQIGTFMSLEGSASGRVLAAFADDALLTRLRASGAELPSPDILEQTRADGYAISSGYTHSGVLAVAAPVFDAQGRCIATLSLVIPETRFNLDQLLGPLLPAAAELTAILQGGL